MRPHYPIFWREKVHNSHRNVPSCATVQTLCSTFVKATGAYIYSVLLYTLSIFLSVHLFCYVAAGICKIFFNWFSDLIGVSPRCNYTVVIMLDLSPESYWRGQGPRRWRKINMRRRCCTACVTGRHGCCIACVIAWPLDGVSFA